MIESKWVALLPLVILLAGCLNPALLIDGQDTAEGTNSTSPDGAAAVTVPVDSLPALAEPMTGLDGGRVDIAPPQDWTVLPLGLDYIVRFNADRTVPYPAILLTADDPAGLGDVTADNLGAFASKIGAEVDEESSAKGIKLTEPVHAVTIGDFRGASHMRVATVTVKGKKVLLDRLVLTTVRQGRKYGIELRTPRGEIDQFQPYLYAVAAGMKFVAMSQSPAGQGSPAK